MTRERRSYGFDRRSGSDRRKAYAMGYFARGGVERRKERDRRSLWERRSGWIRVSEWCSMYAGKRKGVRKRK